MKLREHFLHYINKTKLQRFKFLFDVLWFAVIIYGFHWLWWNREVVYFIRHYTSFRETQEMLAHQVFLPSSWLVNHLLGYKIQTYNNTMFFPNGGYIAIERICSGLKQIFEWIILIILFPGSWKHKLWFIPAGIITIHLINIFRIVILSVVLMHWPAQWHHVHDWIMTPFYYAVIFALWVVWVEKIKNRGKSLKTDKVKS